MKALLLVVAIAACSSQAKSPPPTTPPAAGSDACPSDLMSLVGKPCPTEGASCGGGNKPGFSNVVVCKGGVWTGVEVPPPPPPG